MEVEKNAPTYSFPTPVRHTDPDWPVKVIIHWVKNNMPMIGQAYELQGGWEVWAQVEIALLMREERPVVDREQKMFKRNVTTGTEIPRFDLWVPYDAGSPIHQGPSGIELKTRLKGEDSAPFLARLKADYLKIVKNQGIISGNTYVVGISHDHWDLMVPPNSVSFNVVTYPLEVNFIEVFGKDAQDNDKTMYVTWWKETWPNDKPSVWPNE